MLTDLDIEKAKDEYVNAINEINNKYKLPLAVSSLILNNIIVEIERLRQENIITQSSMIKEEKNS